MTTLQKTLVAITVAGLAGIGTYEAIQVSKSRSQIRDMEKQHSTLTEQYQDLEAEHQDATNRLALVADALANTKPVPAELLRLRGEVSKLQKESIEAGTKSALNKITADPQSRALLRTQQKKGMEAIYSDFAKRLNLPPESTEALYDLLADHIMDNIDLITAVLRDGASPQDLDRMFNSLDANLENDLRLKLGDEAADQYKDYTSNLIAALTSSQFAKMLEGDDDAKNTKRDRIAQLVTAETSAVLAEAGLPADYQAIPMLNLRNIASEPRGEQSIKLLDSIYQRVAAQSAAFLTQEELNKFDKFRQEALDNSRMMLTMNRKMMQPIAQ